MALPVALPLLLPLQKFNLLELIARISSSTISSFPHVRTRHRFMPFAISVTDFWCTRKYDSPSYTLLPFIPISSQSAYLAIRAFNLEIARVAETVSTLQVGALRLQFWRDNITSTFDGRPPKQPVAVLLAEAIELLSHRSNGQSRFSKSWFMRVISAREQYLNNAPYPTLEALEKYAESTYSTLLYLTLQSLPLSSVTADHLASHIGKASGIVAILRGLPLLAFPPPLNHHSNNSGLSGMVQDQRWRQQQGSVTLPLDIMASAGVREEDVLRQGAEASGLRDAVFQVATRASDHLITARSMLSNLRTGNDVGHGFEHEGEEGHVYDHETPTSSSTSLTNVQFTEVEQAFGVLMPAVSTSLWLDRLQKVDFDIFRTELRRREWRLPFKAFLAYRRREF